MTKYPDPDFLRPGSTAALDAGCLCPVLDNEYGQGYEMQPGVFVYNGNCPIHGIKGNPELWARDLVDAVPPSAAPPETLARFCCDEMKQAISFHYGGIAGVKFCPFCGKAQG